MKLLGNVNCYIYMFWWLHSHSYLNSKLARYRIRCIFHLHLAGHAVCTHSIIILVLLSKIHFVFKWNLSKTSTTSVDFIFTMLQSAVVVLAVLGGVTVSCWQIARKLWLWHVSCSAEKAFEYSIFCYVNVLYY